MKNIFLPILCCLATMLQAQDFNNYQTLTSQGTIPRDYITSSTVKYQGEISKIDKLRKSKREKKTRAAFALESNFVLDDMLQSGLVIFNDEVTTYLNKVIAQLTAVDNMKVHVYTLRSAAVNAFATPRGDIFVTLGLLSQLENEAQLAFILAHELTHVKKEHSIALYLTAAGLGKNSKRNEVMRNASFDTKLLAKCRYSKELETEADHDGIERFLQTKYSTQTLMQVYDVLKYSYLPFDDVPFDVSVFESKDYKLPSKAILAKTSPISTEDKELDEAEEERSTHPSIPIRRDHLKSVLKDLKDTLNKSNYLVSQETFKKVRQIARYELPMMYVQNKQIAKSIYTTFLLLKQNPESQYLQKCLLKTLYNHAKFKNQEDYTYESHYKNVEGHSQAAHYLAEKLKAKDMTVLATRYAWMLHQKFPKDNEITTITNDLLAEMGKHFKSLKSFKTPNTEIKAVAAPKVQKDTAELSKYDKIKSSKDSSSNTNDYAFAEFVQDTAFIKAFAKGHDAYKERENRVKYYESEEGRKDYAQYEKNTKKKGLKLGISKIVIVNPFYLKLDARKDNAVQYIATEEGQEHQRELIETAAKAAQLQTEILDVTHLKESQIDAFNDIRFLNEYFSEQNKLSGLSLTPGAQQTRIDAIAKKYGTDYFLWTGTVSLREQNIPLGFVFATLIVPPAFPFAVANYLTPQYNMMHYAVLYDVRTGRNQTIKAEFFDDKDSDAMMKSHLYDTFLQIRVSDDQKPATSTKKKQKTEKVEEDNTEDVKEKETVENDKDDKDDAKVEKEEKETEKEVEKPKKEVSSKKKQKVSASSDSKSEEKPKKKKK